MAKQNLRPLLLVTALEGAVTILFLLLSRSKEQGVLWGYSVCCDWAWRRWRFWVFVLTWHFIPWGMKNEQKIIDRLISSSRIISGAAMVVLAVLIALIVISMRGDWIILAILALHRTRPHLCWRVCFNNSAVARLVMLREDGFKVGGRVTGIVFTCNKCDRFYIV